MINRTLQHHSSQSTFSQKDFATEQESSGRFDSSTHGGKNMKAKADQVSAARHRVTGYLQHSPGMVRAERALWKVTSILSALLIVCMLLPLHAVAQEFRGTISGNVTDQSGAAVQGAVVEAVETLTGAIHRTKSDKAGHYVLPYLLPGDYLITVKSSGFKVLTRSGITLQAQEEPVINLVLSVGSASQTVTVSAATPLLDQENGSIGDVIPVKEVDNIPLNGRSPAALALLTVGVTSLHAPTQQRPFDNGNFTQISIGGAPSLTSDVLLDGAPDMSQTGEVAYNPPEDATQEVSVQPFATDASFGHTASAVINLVTKSGTNQLHGSAYEFSQISDLDANLYFNDRTNPVTPKPVTHYNQYGATVGGPIWIPKLFDGRNKLFFFFAFEGLKDSQPAAELTSVPTDAEKQGDFSALLAGGSSYQLYEPNTGTLNNGKFTRTAVPNNCLTNQSNYCSSLANAGISINPIALAYLKLYPEPNYSAGVSPITNQDNFLSDAPSLDNFNSEFGRLDYNASARNHLFFDFRRNLRIQTKDDYFHNAVTGDSLVYGNDGATLDDVVTLNPTTVFDVRLNWTYFNNISDSPQYNSSPNAAGFPSYMQSATQYPMLPTINFNSSSYYDADSHSPEIAPSTSYQVYGSMMKSFRKHTLKIGFDGRQYREQVTNYTSPSGSFTFGNNFVESGSGGAKQPFGGDLASFEYGLPTSGSFGLTEMADYRSYYIGTFIQDDWQVSHQLTLNLGLRFDIDTPFGEKFGRTVSGWNPIAVNSASTAAAAAFAPTTVTANGSSVTVSSINTLGGLTFPSSDWGAPYQIENKGFWSPRIGFAYSPAWFSKIVVRGGFGTFVMPPEMIAIPASGKAQSAAVSYTEGFSTSTSYNATNDSYFQSLNSLSSPFPNGFSQPAGSALGASTFLGSPSAIGFYAPVQHDMYSERWTLGVQYAPTGSTMLEAIYMGNHGVHLPVDTQNINEMEAQYLSKAPYQDENLSIEAATAVKNPFAGLLPAGNSNFNGATTSLGSLLVPYPAYGSTAITEQNESIGQSFYEGGMLHIEQHAQHGLTLTANYSYSRRIDEINRLNDVDTFLNRMDSPNEFRNHIAAGAIYDLPFGRGRAVSLGGGKLMDELFGGFELGGIYQFQSGTPIDFSTDIPLQPGMTIKDIKSQPRNANATSTALSTNVFVTGSNACTVSAGQPCDGTVFFNGQYVDHYRTLPQTIGSVRSDGFNEMDASLLKNIKFTEGVHFQLRFETFNLLNHPVFSAPAVSSATNSDFGHITAVAAGSLPRQVQLGGRLVF